MSESSPSRSRSSSDWPPRVEPSRGDDPLLARSRSFPGEHRVLAEIGAWVQDLCRAAGFSPRVAGEVELAAAEAVTNIIDHALMEDPEARFHLSAWAWKGCVEVVLVDQGPSFDPREAPAPDLDAPLEDRPVGGLGIYLMRHFLDSVAWERDQGRNILRLRRGPLREEAESGEAEEP